MYIATVRSEAFPIIVSSTKQLAMFEARVDLRVEQGVQWRYVRTRVFIFAMRRVLNRRASPGSGKDVEGENATSYLGKMEHSIVVNNKKLQIGSIDRL